MKVLHFIPSLRHVAGSALLSYKIDLLRLMSGQAEVGVLTSDAGNVSLGDVHIERYSALRAVGGLGRGKLAGLLADISPDVVHIHAIRGMAAFTLFRICRRMHIPVVISPDRRLEPWHASRYLLPGRPVVIGPFRHYMLSRSLALHAVCRQEAERLKRISRLPWRYGTAPLNDRVVGIDAFNIVGGRSVADMLADIMALYRKMIDTSPFLHMTAEEHRAEDVLVMMGASVGYADVTVPDEDVSAVRSLEPNSWRRIFIHSADEGITSCLMAGINALGLDVSRIDVAAIPRFTLGGNGSGARVGQDNDSRRLRKLRSDDSLGGVEREVCLSMVDAIMKARRSCIHRSDFVDLYRLLRFNDFDEDKVEERLRGMGLLKQAARILKILEEHYSLTDGYMFTVPLDDSGTAALRKKLFKSEIQ